jgi:predicted TIM-barrel fold metal-dependent hydrolase
MSTTQAGFHLPESSPVPIVDPFCQLHVGEAGIQVPMPKAALRDDESRRAWPSTGMVAHLFKHDAAYAEREAIAGNLHKWIENLDRFRISRAGVPLTSDTSNELFDQLSEHAERIFVTLRVDPHEGMRAVRRIDELCRTYSFIRSVSLTPHQLYPAIPPSSKEYYPVYTKCAELDVAVFINVGIPGPRVPAACQNPMELDEVCWFFPDLRVVMRHGGVPWAEACVELLVRWPHLYYATTGFAPRYYPKAVMDYANSRGSSKVIFAGYWPNLAYERIFDELSDLPLKPEVWPKFLSLNAITAFAL